MTGGERRLVEALMNALNLEDFLEVIDAIRKDAWRDPARIAGLASVVDEVAEGGDGVAGRILARAGAEMACAVAVRLEIADSPIVVGGVGSVFKSSH
ncbi:MAG: hypothetical protein DRK00_06600 [Thermoprotei archaeon]|nr:MAG: hypothetical protein DRK00_06600 [Thermoprotei archaeon]